MFPYRMISHFPVTYTRLTKYGLRHYIYKCVSINQGINSRYSRIWYPISSMRWGCKHHIHRNADNISLLLPPLYFACCTQKDCISYFILINLIKVTFYTEYIEYSSEYTNEIVLTKYHYQSNWNIYHLHFSFFTRVIKVRKNISNTILF